MMTALLLFISNIFMTLAWYGHLKFKDKPLWLVIVASWALAFFEYLFQVPANRIGSAHFTLAQLKVMQECITIVVFTIIVWLVFRQIPRWNNVISFLLIVAAVWFYIQYTLIVSKEEEYLAERFGADYEHYRQSVPRFIPRPTPYVAPNPPPKQVRTSEGYASERRTLQAIGLVTFVIVGMYLVQHS